MSFSKSKVLVYLSVDNNTLIEGKEVEVSLNLNCIETVAFTVYIYFDDLKLEYISGPENISVDKNRIIFVWYDEDGGNTPKTGELGKIKFKAKESGIANFNIEGEFYNNEQELIDTDFQELSIQIGIDMLKSEVVQSQNNEEIASNTENEIIENNHIIESSQNYLNPKNANLEVLAVQDVLLYPTFDTNVTSYNIEIGNSITKLNILAIPENELANIQILGNEELNIGDNLIKIMVTSR